MKESAELCFYWKYRKFIIEVCTTMEKDQPKYKAKNDYLTLLDPKTCFGVLRCFGHNFNSHRLYHTRLDGYVMKYCVNNVTELNIFENERSSKNLQSPFPNVETVRFIDCILDGSSIRFNEWFPKMRRLEFITVRDLLFKHLTEFDNQSFIVDHFPNLEHLSVHFADGENSGFDEGNILAALKLNPNIRSLYLHRFGYPSKSYQSAFFQEIRES